MVCPRGEEKWEKGTSVLLLQIKSCITDRQHNSLSHISLLSHVARVSKAVSQFLLLLLFLFSPDFPSDMEGGGGKGETKKEKKVGMQPHTYAEGRRLLKRGVGGAHKISLFSSPHFFENPYISFPEDKEFFPFFYQLPISLQDYPGRRTWQRKSGGGENLVPRSSPPLF